MPYCRFCGMGSAEAAKCSWCGHSLTDTAPAELHSTTDAVPASMVWYLRGVEILSLVAVGAGWIASSAFRPLYMSR